MMMAQHRLTPDLSGAPSRSRNGGFTLVELIISIVLVGLLAVVGSSMIADSFGTSRMVNANNASTAQARYALERLAREIREVAYVSGTYTITTRTTNNFVFTKSNGATITICNGIVSTSCMGGPNLYLSDSSLTSTPTPTLASQVNSFELTYFQNDGVRAATSNSDIRFVVIALTVTDATSGQSISQRTRVALRNA